MEPRTSAGNPVFSTTNTSCFGSKADVISGAEAGAYVTVNIHHKNSYSYFVYGSRIQFVYGQGTCEAAVHLPWFVCRKAGMLFHNPPFWFMLLVSTEKTYEVSRWYIGLHKYKDIQSLYSGSTDWYIDSCWKIFYSHGENGETIVGSTANLQNAILNGRRIIIVFDSYAMEADNIVIDNGLVIVQLLSQVETASIKTFMSQDAVWKWVRIASDGSYFVDWYEVGAANSVGRDATNMSASWFVERRHWMLALSMTGDTIQQGSKSDLETAIRSGSRVRCVVKESLSRTLFVTADNLEIYPTTGDISAQFTRLISFDPHFVPFWRILILSTRGEMKETHWTVGEHVKRGEDVTNVDIDWFVD